MSLSDTQKRILEKVVSCSLSEGFYLAGGTAIAIKYNHRPSDDFDFFTFPEICFDSTRIRLKGDRLGVVWSVLSRDTVIFRLNDGEEWVSFSFFDYPYKLIGELEYRKNMGIYIADDKDIVCMKAIAIAQRGSKKDFYDLWFLMREKKWSIEELTNFLNLKYPNYQTSIFLKALSYFHDAEKEKNPFIDPDWKKVKKFFSKAIFEYLKNRGT